MNMRNCTRHTVDFEVMPNLIREHGTKFVKTCLKDRERHICEIYNHFFCKVFRNYNVNYNENDFCITDHKMHGNQKILYIELPPKQDDSSVYCTAYAISYEKTLFGIKNTLFFTVESSAFGTTCIGAMAPNGGHLNYGEAYPTKEQNLQAIYQLVSNR